jgi:hypothetical protein
MAEEKLFFDTIKEDRGPYFVEYKPPIASCRFATLSLVYPHRVDPATVAKTVETELNQWLTRFPIPLMVSAFDEKGDLYRLEGVRPSNHAIGFLDPITKRVRIFWELLENDQIPSDALDTNYLKTVYSNVGYRTSEDLARESRENIKRLRIGWAIFFVWLIIVPAILAVLEWLSPPWMTFLVMLYSLWKAFEKGMKLTGRWKKSRRELEKEKEEQDKGHHHYHCKANPEGFLRLKVENFARWERERIQSEAESLKSKEKLQP